MTASEYRKSIKEEAKARLRGRWGTGVAVILLVLVMGVIASVIGTVFTGFLGFFFPVLNRFIDDFQSIVADISAVDMLESRLDMLLELYFSSEAFLLQAAFYLGISFIIGLLVSLVDIPASYGAYSWAGEMARGAQPPATQVFKFYTSAKLFFRSFGMAIAQGFFAFLWSLLFTAGAGVVAAGSTFLLLLLQSEFFAASTIFLIVAACAACSLGLAVLLQRYTLAPYAFAMNPQNGILYAIRRSVELTRGHRFELFVFSLSFLGWMLLSVYCTCSIGLLFLMPYMYLSYAIFYLRAEAYAGNSLYAPPEASADQPYSEDDPTQFPPVE